MSNPTSTPRVDGSRMPIEREPHEQTWMVWSERPNNWRNGGKLTQAAFIAVAEAITRLEPVTVCASAGQYENTRARLDDGNIHVMEISNDDARVHDTGPTFVIDDKGDVRGAGWGSNAWGGFEGDPYFPWQRDDQVARKILEIERCTRYRTDNPVLEGGLIHVDDEGTLITTEECLLNHNRNPYLNQAEIERTLRDHLAVDSIIWLPNGLYNDETDGHVDNFCCYVRPGEVLLAWTNDRDDLNYLRCQAALRVLEESRDTKGCKLVVHKVPIPGPLYATQEEYDGVDIVRSSQSCDPSIRLAGSYVNFLIVNGGIVVSSLDDPKDAEARVILRRVFPEHEVAMVPGREILLGGGNIHCITQRQPAPREAWRAPPRADGQLWRCSRWPVRHTEWRPE